MEIRHYLDPRGRDPYQTWFDGLQDMRAKVVVMRRIDRLENGNAGDNKYCRGGVWEMRIDQGPGYRVYFARDGDSIVVLMGGGNKASQRRDLERAIAAWQDYVERTR